MIVFWISLIFLIYVYLGYPLLIALLRSFPFPGKNFQALSCRKSV